MMSIYKGFTLVELMIVVVIIGILAAIVVPQFSDASVEAKSSTLRTNVDIVRAQLELYYDQHNGNYPTSVETFVDQMTKYTKSDGTVNDTRDPANGFIFGTYLLSVPNNPYTDSNTVGSGGVGTSDWYYDAATGLFRENHE